MFIKIAQRLRMPYWSRLMFVTSSHKACFQHDHPSSDSPALYQPICRVLSSCSLDRDDFTLAQATLPDASHALCSLHLSCIAHLSAASRLRQEPLSRATSHRIARIRTVSIDETLMYADSMLQNSSIMFAVSAAYITDSVRCHTARHERTVVPQASSVLSNAIGI